MTFLKNDPNSRDREVRFMARYWLADEILPQGDYLMQSMDVGAAYFRVSDNKTPATRFCTGDGVWLISVPFWLQWPESPTIQKPFDMFRMIDLVLDGWVCECVAHSDPKWVWRTLWPYKDNYNEVAICWDKEKSSHATSFGIDTATRAASYMICDPQPKNSPRRGETIPGQRTALKEAVEGAYTGVCGVDDADGSQEANESPEQAQGRTEEQIEAIRKEGIRAEEILSMIQEERHSQINDKYPPWYDDTDTNGELAQHAAYLATPTYGVIHSPLLNRSEKGDKTRIEGLVSAAAMIVAEIGRLKRSAEARKKSMQKSKMK